MADDPPPARQASAALLATGKALADRADDEDARERTPEELQEASRAFDAPVSGFRESHLLEAREHVADALFWKSQALSDLGQPDETLAVLSAYDRSVAPDAPESASTH